MAARSANISILVNQIISIHASVADYRESVFIWEGLCSNFQICKFNVIAPGGRDFKMLQFLIAKSCSLKCFESVAKVAQGVVNVNSIDALRLSFPEVTNQESWGIEDCFIEEWSLNNCLVTFLYKFVNELISLIYLSKLHVLIEIS